MSKHKQPKTKVHYRGRTVIKDPFSMGEGYSLGPDGKIHCVKKDDVDIRVTIDINDKRTGQAQKISAMALKGMTRQELVDVIEGMTKHCLKACALKHYDEIFKELNGLQKLQKIAKEVKK